MTAVAAPGIPEDDDVLDHVPCLCGALAAVVMTIDEEGLVTVAAKCGCGSFTPVAAGGGER